MALKCPLSSHRACTWGPVALHSVPTFEVRFVALLACDLRWAALASDSCPVIGTRARHLVLKRLRVSVWFIPPAALLVPVIQRRIIDTINSQLGETTLRFQDELQTGAWLQHVSLHADAGVSPTNASSGASASAAASASSSSSSAAAGHAAEGVDKHDLAPPRALLAFLPLAESVNGVLALLNFLRQCMPVQCGGSLVAGLRRHAVDVVQVLVEVKAHRPGWSTSGSSSHGHYHHGGSGGGKAATDTAPKKFRSMCEVSVFWGGPTLVTAHVHVHVRLYVLSCCTCRCCLGSADGVVLCRMCVVHLPRGEVMIVGDLLPRAVQCAANHYFPYLNRCLLAMGTPGATGTAAATTDVIGLVRVGCGGVAREDLLSSVCFHHQITPPRICRSDCAGGGVCECGA